MSKTLKQDKKNDGQTERVSSYAEYETCGKKFSVIRRFNGEKELQKIIEETAVARADRETGLN